MTVSDTDSRSASKQMKRIIAGCCGAFVRLTALAAGLWSFGAIHFGVADWLPAVVCWMVTLLVVAIAVFLSWRYRRRRHWAAVSGALMLVGCVLLLLRSPLHNRPWAKDHARVPSVRIEEDVVTISNFRHCEYRSELDYDANYREFDFPIADLKRVWFGVQRFTTWEGLAHTFLSFEVDGPDGPRYFCVSVEIRRERGEVFSPIQGLYRQFELIYVIGDERDVIGVRTIHRPNDRVFLYPVNADAAHTQALFRDIARRAEAIREQPEFYHSLINNCTNNIAAHTNWLVDEPVSSADLQIVIPGYSDRFAYSRGFIGNGELGFSDLQAACRVDELARRAGLSQEFSMAIRVGL
ncbi:MAG: DUF4105 domain-containing protein [Planctomycetaceae bacterium]